MTTGTLGRVYEDGDILARQGDVGDVMYVIQEGEVEICAHLQTAFQSRAAGGK